MTIAKRVEFAVSKAWDLPIEEEGGKVAYGIDKDTYVRLEREGARRVLSLYYKGKGIARYEGEEVFTSLVLDAFSCNGKAAARRLFGFANFQLLRVYWVTDNIGGRYSVIDDWDGKVLPSLVPGGLALRIGLDTRKARYVALAEHAAAPLGKAGGEK